MNPGTTRSYFGDFFLMKKACKLPWFIDLTQTPPQISPARLGAVTEERLESWIGEYHELKCHMMNQINLYIYTVCFLEFKDWIVENPPYVIALRQIILKYEGLSSEKEQEPHTRFSQQKMQTNHIHDSQPFFFSQNATWLWLYPTLVDRISMLHAQTKYYDYDLRFRHLQTTEVVHWIVATASLKPQLCIYLWLATGSALCWL